MLRPLISPNNSIMANPGNNSLVITDYADNLARLGKIIAALDQPNASEIEVIALKHGLILVTEDERLQKRAAAAGILVFDATTFTARLS